VGSIPFTNFLHNFYAKKFILEEKSSPGSVLKMYIYPYPKFHLICIKSIMDNFVLFLGYFSLINFFAVKEKEEKTLTQRENYDIFKETMNSNETFKRIEVLYMKDEPLLKKYDISGPIIYSTFIMAVIYSPFEYLVNTLLNNNLTLRQYLKIVSKGGSEDNLLLTRSNMFLRLKYVFGMNIMTYFIKYGLTVYNYEEYFNSKG
jgi:hypothetical protein